MTLPKALRERFIFVVYLTPSAPLLSVFCLSDPAKSTKLSLPTLNFKFPFSSVDCSSTFILNMQCDLEDYLFILVCLTDLFLYPILRYFSSSSPDLTRKVLTPSMTNPLLGVYLRLSLFLVSSARRSCTLSL